MSWDDRADRIDRGRPDYVWRQIADDIRADIESGALPERAKVPSGPELAEIYSVANATIANAISALRDEGVVVVLRGRGTFVAEKALVTHATVSRPRLWRAGDGDALMTPAARGWSPVSALSARRYCVLGVGKAEPVDRPWMK